MDTFRIHIDNEHNMKKHINKGKQFNPQPNLKSKNVPKPCDKKADVKVSDCGKFKKPNQINDENCQKYNKNKPFPKRLKQAETNRQPLVSVCVEKNLKAEEKNSKRNDISQISLPDSFVNSVCENVSNENVQVHNVSELYNDDQNSYEDDKPVDIDRMLFVDEYKNYINNYLHELEIRYQPRKNYMSRQPDVTYSMRSILVDWLIAVADEYKFHQMTLYLAVSYIDRFLSSMSVVRHKLQLVGAAAMMVAAKVEEIYPPETSEYVYLTGDAYTSSQILRMEKVLLKTLQFEVTTPTVQDFLSQFCAEDEYNPMIMYLAMYFCELSLVEGQMYLVHLPSEIAAGAVALARYTLSESEPWPKTLEDSSGYTWEHLSPVIKQQQQTFKESPTTPQQAVNEKYKKEKYGHIATIKPRLLCLD